MLMVPYKCWKQKNAALLAHTVSTHLTKELQKIMTNGVITFFTRRGLQPHLQKFPCIEMVEETVAHGSRKGKKNFTVYVTDCRSQGHLAVRNQIIRGLTAN